MRLPAYCFLLLAMFSASAFSSPLNRTVVTGDASGKSWREAGTMPVSVVAAQQAWEVALRSDGWVLLHVIPLETKNTRQLFVWKKNRETFLLCLWSLSPSQSGFMWGIADDVRKDFMAKPGILPAPARPKSSPMPGTGR
ncbi:MAG: hypothetical protein BWY31_00903 [Lentisphaerae bacterium ADurb.Bin242]|nr:MAG: hypothetical protein BWY31_00903 [Lentisphaerae bacterium ADurb.Bin242]